MSDAELIESLRLWNRDDAADRIEALIYEYSGRIPLAAAIGVLHLVAYEITKDSD
jgi:hypothetical protein